MGNSEAHRKSINAISIYCFISAYCYSLLIIFIVSIVFFLFVNYSLTKTVPNMKMITIVFIIYCTVFLTLIFFSFKVSLF